MPYFYQRSPLVKNQNVEDLKSIETFFKEKFDIDIYLVYGTLLGAVREKDFILHDGDIDIGYLSKKNKKEDVIQELIEIYKVLQQHEMLVKFWAGQTHILSSNKRLIVDLWSSWIEDNKYYLINQFSGQLTEDMILPFTKVTLRGVEFLAPKELDIILTFSYGNWRLLDKDWKCTRKKSYLGIKDIFIEALKWKEAKHGNNSSISLG